MARRLAVPRLQVWWWGKTGDFVEPMVQAGPAGSTGGGGRGLWDPGLVDAWALARGYGDRVRLDRWPGDSRPAYGGVQHLTGAIAQLWPHDLGTVALVWRLPGQYHPPRAQWVRELRERQDGRVKAVVVVDRDFAPSGLPNLTGLLPDRHGPNTMAALEPEARDHWGQWSGPVRTYSPRWQDFSRVVGMAVPWWSDRLRRADLIEAWAPDTAPVTTLAVPDLDTAALLQLAAVYDREHPSAQVLTALAQVSTHRTTATTFHDVDLVEKAIARLALEADPDAGTDGVGLVVAARPVEAPEVDPADLDPTLRRAGWLDVLRRTDTVAQACVVEVMRQDGGADFPYSNPETVAEHASPAAREWAARLQPVPEPLPASFALLSYDPTNGAQALIDPETDAPVIRPRRGPLSVAIPQRLPAHAPLQEVILGNPIWVRTSDGIIWPAPKDSYYGLSWGYSGSGPGTLALLIGRLLDDINATAAADLNGEEAIERLLQLPLPTGTVLARADLEAVRAGHPIPRHILEQVGRRYPGTNDTDDTDDTDDLEEN